TGTFADKNVANGKTVTTTGFALAGGDAANYTLSSQPTTTANITPASITLTPDAGQHKTYGSSDPTLTYHLTAGTLFGRDALSGALSRAAGESVPGGPYLINQATLSASGNYTVNFTSGPTFNIDPAALSIPARSRRENEGEVYSFTGNEFDSSGLK